MTYEERAAWDPFWLVDPLDGTKEFIKRNGEFTVNIALIRGKTAGARRRGCRCSARRTGAPRAKARTRAVPTAEERAISVSDYRRVGLSVSPAVRTPAS